MPWSTPFDEAVPLRCGRRLALNSGKEANG
jgi:hypothetical protein